jgi:hypothetical protein
MNVRPLLGILALTLSSGCVAQAGVMEEEDVNQVGNPFMPGVRSGDPRVSGALLDPTLDKDSPARRQVEHDLLLTITRKETRFMEEGGDPGLVITLTNRSQQRAWPVVLAGDGSEAGWREPWVFFTVERRSENGPWEQARQAQLGRCGNFDRDWAKDVVTLGGGESRTLEGIPFIGYEAAMEGAAAIRITAHYIYRQGNVVRSLFATPNAPPSMEGVPSFTISSEPMELLIERPLRLEVELHALPEQGGPVEDIVTVAATNVSSHDVVLPRKGGSIDLQLDGVKRDLTGQREQLRSHLRFGMSWGIAAEETMTLAPGQRVTLTSEQLAGTTSDGMWGYGVRDLRNGHIQRMRASFSWSIVRSDSPPDAEYPQEDQHLAISPWQTFPAHITLSDARSP